MNNSVNLCAFSSSMAINGTVTGQGVQYKILSQYLIIFQCYKIIHGTKNCWLDFFLIFRMPRLKRKSSSSMASEPKRRPTRSQVRRSTKEPEHTDLQDVGSSPVHPEEVSPLESPQEQSTDDLSTVFTIDTARIQETVTAGVISAITEQVGQAMREELVKAFPASMLTSSKETQLQDAQASTANSPTTPTTQTPATAFGESLATGLLQAQYSNAQTAAATAVCGPGLGPDPVTLRSSPGGALCVRQGLIPNVALGRGSLTNLPGLGESLGSKGSLPLSAPLSLDFAVNQEIKEKIWANEYIDFGLLLNPSQAGQSNIIVQNTASGNGSSCLIPSNKKVPKTINDWLSAFAIFGSVYIAKYPRDGSSLLKYGEIIRQIAGEGGNFNTYDVSLRKLRQTTLIEWNNFHTELYLKALRGTSTFDGVKIKQFTGYFGQVTN